MKRDSLYHRLALWKRVDSVYQFLVDNAACQNFIWLNVHSDAKFAVPRNFSTVQNSVNAKGCIMLANGKKKADQQSEKREFEILLSVPIQRTFSHKWCLVFLHRITNVSKMKGKFAFDHSGELLKPWSSEMTGAWSNTSSITWIIQSFLSLQFSEVNFELVLLTLLQIMSFFLQLVRMLLNKPAIWFAPNQKHIKGRNEHRCQRLWFSLIRHN